MENKLEKYYSDYVKLEKIFNLAKETDNKTIEDVVGKEIYHYEGKIYETEGTAFGNLFSDFVISVQKGNKYINLYYTNLTNKNDDDILKLIELMRENGIEYFTYNEKLSGTIDVVWKLIQNGCELKGMMEIINSYNRKIPAFVFRIEEVKK